MASGGCCGGPAPQAQSPIQSLPYKYLLKYIIVGDTGIIVLLFHCV